VTVQLPIYNEFNVVERLISCVAALDYPKDRLEIQVLDDSDDGTTAVVERLIVEQRRNGVDIKHVRRGSRDGYKAGALQHGLLSSTGDLIAVFDADFLPDSDFLQVTVARFIDASIGVVQTRWGVNDAHSSLLTRVQAFVIECHFGIEQAGRSAQGCFINFNGSGGVWRAAAIRDAGGWAQSTICEDLDISVRAQLLGWKFVYLDDVVTETELPRDMRSFRIQQYRWMKGVAQNAVQLTPRVLRARLPMKVKVHACAQLLESGLYITTFLVPLLTAMLALTEPPGARLWIGALAPLFVAGGVLLWVGYYLHARAARGDVRFGSIVWTWVEFFVVTLGLSTHNTVAVLDGLIRRGGAFDRTPKMGRRDGSSVHYVPRGLDRITFVELSTWLLIAGLLIAGVSANRLPLMWLSILMFIGLTIVLILTGWHAAREGMSVLNDGLAESPVSHV
jgi:glycosyltransferase involved in cell wall biosynthesis